MKYLTMDYLSYYILVLTGILFTDPITAAITACTKDPPTLGIFYNKYCWDTQFCCNAKEKVCCNNGEVCSGSTCLNIGGIVGGCISLIIGISVTVVVICCILKKKKQQAGVVHTRPGQVISMNTYNQTQQYPQSVLQQPPVYGQPYPGYNQPQGGGYSQPQTAGYSQPQQTASDDLPPKY